MRSMLGVVVLSVALGAQAAQVQQESQGVNRALDPAQDAAFARGVGVVRNVEQDGRHVTIAHEPIPEFSWPANGDHRLAVRSPELLKGVRPGQRVRFNVSDAGIITVLQVVP